MEKIDFFEKDKEFLIDYITKTKAELGKKIVIPAHHYQSPDIVQFGDIIGDSYKLAVDCAKTDAEFIIFCGVLFMAEGASILAKPNQRVILPETSAGCPMADMADLPLVEKVYANISEMCKNKIAPVVYMNSYADLKSFCGKYEGAVCTSSNATKIMEYFFNENKSILFFPDYYLGKNTANLLNIDEKEIVKINKNLTLESLGNFEDAKVFLWDGFCPVHQRFTLGDVKALRADYEGIKIIVHPECPEEVVNEADYSGSTQKIFNMINESPDGSIWGVGTETTFVERLAKDNPNKTIVPLRESKCKNMIKITLPHLASSLANVKEVIEMGAPLKNEIRVNSVYVEYAKRALNKMIEIVES